MKIKIIFSLIVLSFLLVGCGGQEKSVSQADGQKDIEPETVIKESITGQPESAVTKQDEPDLSVEDIEEDITEEDISVVDDLETDLDLSELDDLEAELENLI